MEEINKILEKFTKKPYLVKMGAKKIARRYHFTEDNVREARRIWHNKYCFLIDAPILAESKEPKILILDIETAPMKAFVWKRWKENVSLEQTISEWFMICWSAKWLGSNTIYSGCLTPEEILNEDDKRITESIAELLDECDVAVAYNGCVEKDTPILMKDFTWRKAGELKEGDEIIAFEEGLSPNMPLRDSNGKWNNPLGRPRKLKLAKVTYNNISIEECVKVKFTNGYELITTYNHPWLMKTASDNFLKWRDSIDLKPGDRVIRICKPWEINNSYEGAWMSGFIEGEGSLIKDNNHPSAIQWCQRPTMVKERADKYADILDIKRFDYVPHANCEIGRGDCVYTNTMGGKWQVFKWLGSLRLERLSSHVDYENLGFLYGQNSDTNDQETLYVESVEPCGEHEIAQLSTTTGTYIADGFAMHNCAFDFPKIQTRMIVNGIKPVSAYKVIDPKIIAKKQFGFSSNKLDSLARMFGFNTKLETSFELWRDCMNGKQEALDYMVKYNQYDVELLEKVYLKIVPYAKGLPNLNVYRSQEKLICPVCGCEHIEQIEDYHTNTNTYDQYRCKDCGAISRARKTNKINRNNFLIPL